MSVTVEKLEKSMAKLKITVSADQLEKALQKAYEKNKNKIQLPGFRKGKAPRKMIERMYGVGVFYEDAANELINNEYPKAVDECGESIVSNPKIEVVQIESGKPFIFTAEVALKPPVKLGKYKGVDLGFLFLINDLSGILNDGPALPAVHLFDLVKSLYYR